MRKSNTLYTVTPYNKRLFAVEEDDTAEEKDFSMPKHSEDLSEKKQDDKLHVVNKYNAKKFNKRTTASKENIYDGFQFGSSQMRNASTLNFSLIDKNSFGGSDYKAPTMTHFTDWSNPTQRSLALGKTKAMGENFKFNADQIVNAFGTGKEAQTVGLAPIDSAERTGTSGSTGGGMGNLAKAGIGAAAGIAQGIGASEENPRGMFDVLDPVHALAGGRESAVGNAMSDAGVGVFQAGASSGQPYLMIAGAALKVLGGLSNAAFGIKADKKMLNRANESISSNKNFTSGASSFDFIKGPAAASNTNVYEGGWFSGGKADDKNEALAKEMADAYSWADRSVQNNINNLTSDQINEFLRNYSAFGGYLTRPKRKRKIKR